MNSNTKKLTVAALMLALCIAAQFFKNASVYFTGSIVNLALIITALYCGIRYATILAVITPVTAFLITGAPLIAACPMILPCIMIGNQVIVLFAWLARGRKNEGIILPISLLVGSFAKAAVMFALVIYIIIPLFGGNLKEPQVAAARVAYSTTQLIAALIASVLACVIWRVLKVAIRNDENLR